MGYASIRQCVQALERRGDLIRITSEVDPYLEAAEIQRRVYAAGGPALFFENVKGSRFPMASNLFGTLDRARFLFRDALEAVRRVIELKVDPTRAFKQPFRYLGVPLTGYYTLPQRVSTGSVFQGSCRVSELPQLVSWPRDGGPFITLPQVYTEDPTQPSSLHSNLGMYRVQLGGNEYAPDREVGLHYQIHRGIGVHHQAALERGEPLRVSIFVGGPPAMTLAAVMPLPEGLSEVAFAGALARRRVLLSRGTGHVVHVDADFCLVGRVRPDGLAKPEGPFGDHLGYYSLTHPFPVLEVEQVYHRPDAVWPFTVVGRPPQEDTAFGALIHELTGPVIPTVLPGVRAVHAVDESGVHPLLLAIGSERYTPYAPTAQPQELLTQANAILGQGQMSLAKYLWICAEQDAPHLKVSDVQGFFRHMLARADWSRDLHFQTRTTMDTLDYSGGGFNQGSKLVVAAVGDVRRTLVTEVPSELPLPEGFGSPRMCLPGVLALEGPAHATHPEAVQALCAALDTSHPLNQFALVAVVDDSDFISRSLANWLWVTFTRSDPARDVHGVGARTLHKHWGCEGVLCIDARIKAHHAPPLEEDPEVSLRVDAMFAKGGPFAGLE